MILFSSESELLVLTLSVAEGKDGLTKCETFGLFQLLGVTPAAKSVSGY